MREHKKEAGGSDLQITICSGNIKCQHVMTLPSYPFKLGKEKRIAIKVIDHRGNEVVVVREPK